MAGTVRRELSRQDYARRGLLTLLAIVLLLAAVMAKSSGAVGGPAEVTAVLRNAGGSLTKGSDVKMRGVILGRVEEISAAPDGAVQVGISIAEERLERVPANVVARILPATVFGTSFVDLVVHGKPATDHLRGGARIAPDRTQGTLEVQQALDDIDRLVKALGPAQLASAIGATAAALDGHGDDLGSLLDGTDAYLGKLGPRMPLLRSDLRKLAANLQLAADVAPDLLKATNDALTTARTVVAEKAAIAMVISGGTTLTGEADQFLSRNRGQLVRFVHNAALLLDVLYDTRHQAITDALITNHMVAQKLKSTLRHGFVDTMTKFTTIVPPYYGPADCPRYGVARGDNCGGGALGRVAASSMLDRRRP